MRKIKTLKQFWRYKHLKGSLVVSIGILHNSSEQVCAGSIVRSRMCESSILKRLHHVTFNKTVHGINPTSTTLFFVFLNPATLGHHNLWFTKVAEKTHSMHNWENTQRKVMFHKMGRESTPKRSRTSSSALTLLRHAVRTSRLQNSRWLDKLHWWKTVTHHVFPKDYSIISTSRLKERPDPERKKRIPQLNHHVKPREINPLLWVTVIYTIF